MNSKIKNGIALSLIPQIILVKWMGAHPDFIEKYYSEGLYPFLSKFFRAILGWIPFSIGDILYFILIVLAVRYIIVSRRTIRNFPVKFLRDIVLVLSVAYFTFHFMWGLNYYRQPISKKFDLQETHTKEELVSLIEKLTHKANVLQFEIALDSSKAVVIPYSKKEIFEKTIVGYEKLGSQLPFLSYQRPSIKKSIFSLPLTYMGYGGYLNPFTNEAQVNGKLPVFRFPVVSGHEIGHQLGYSAENETNLIGYLVTINNPDVYFKYAGYSYALAYCLGELQRNDEAEFKKQYLQLNEGIRKNYQEMNDFWTAYENPLEPLFESIFNSFLKANNQTEGILSYNSVVTLLVNYHKKQPL